MRWMRLRFDPIKGHARGGPPASAALCQCSILLIATAGRLFLMRSYTSPAEQLITAPYQYEPFISAAAYLLVGWVMAARTDMCLRLVGWSPEMDDEAMSSKERDDEVTG